MIDGDEIREARNRAGLSQQQLATGVGVSLRTVGNWERGATVPRDKEHRIRLVLRSHLAASEDLPLRGVSDVELLAEVARRMARAHQAGTGTAPDADDAPGPERTVADVLAARRAAEEPSRGEQMMEMQTEAARDED